MKTVQKSITGRTISATAIAAVTAVVLFFAFCTSAFDSDESLPPYTVGPGGGGALYHPAINPQDPNNFFISCDMGSSFVTHDGGKSFKSLLLGRSVSYAGMPRWWFTPHDENTVYATVGTVVHVSYDKGRTWEFLFPSKNDYVGLAHTATATAVGNVHPHFKTGTLQANYCLLSFYAHPTDKNTLYALSAGKSYGWPTTPATVYRSTDAGNTWEVFKALTNFNVWVDQLQGRSAQMMIFQDELRIATHSGFSG